MKPRAPRRVLVPVNAFSPMKSTSSALKTFRYVAFAATAAGLVGLTGCVAQPVRTRTVVVERPAPREVYVSQPNTPPPVVETAPAYSGEVVIETAPPPVREEIITVRPSRRHVWVGGYWAYRGRGYVWVPGHWMLPPRGHAAWVQPHYERRGHGWILIEGHWR